MARMPKVLLLKAAPWFYEGLLSLSLSPRTTLSAVLQSVGLLLSTIMTVRSARDSVPSTSTHTYSTTSKSMVCWALCNCETRSLGTTGYTALSCAQPHAIPRFDFVRLIVNDDSKVRLMLSQQPLLTQSPSARRALPHEWYCSNDFAVSFGIGMTPLELSHPQRNIDLLGPKLTTCLITSMAGRVSPHLYIHCSNVDSISIDHLLTASRCEMLPVVSLLLTILLCSVLSFYFSIA